MKEQVWTALVFKCELGHLFFSFFFSFYEAHHKRSLCTTRGWITDFKFVWFFPPLSLLLLFVVATVPAYKRSSPCQELCNPLVLSLQVKSMGSGAAWLDLAKSCIRLHSNVLDNNPDWAGPAHMRGDEIYPHLRLRLEWPPPRLIK